MIFRKCCSCLSKRPNAGAIPSPLFVGIAAGILLGLCLTIWDDDDVIISRSYFSNVFRQGADLSNPFILNLPIQLAKQAAKHENRIPWLRCIVLLESSEGFKPEKQFSAIRDTWARECNQTLYFTDSRALHNRFVDELSAAAGGIARIYLIEGNAGPPKSEIREWAIVRNVLQFIAKLDAKEKKTVFEKWTVLTDGKSYLHSRNLRDLLLGVQGGVSIILGRREQPENQTFLRSLLTNVWPSSSPTSVNGWPLSAATISTEAPMIISDRAFQLILQEPQCIGKQRQSITRWWWPFSGTFIFGGNGQPRYTGRAIGSCALRLGIALWDPVDEESRPLIVNESLRSLFSNRVTKNNRNISTDIASSKNPKVSLQMAKCCSDRSIAFGLLNHKDQRLVDYGVRQLKVFGTRRA